MTGSRAVLFVLLAAAVTGCARPSGPPSGPASAPPADTHERVVHVGHVTYVFRAAPLANLIYQLDCLAELTHCSHAAFEGLWKTQLGGLTDKDKQAIEAWKNAFSHYTGYVEDTNLAEVAAPLPISRSKRDVETSLRIALYGARDLDDVVSRLELFVDPVDAQQARAVLELFSTRFEGFWSTRREDLAQAIGGYVAIASRPDLHVLIGSIARFYEPELGAEARLVVDLIARPDERSGSTSASTSTSAEQLRDHALVEVLPGEPPARNFANVMHESFHGWFAASTAAKQIALANRFATSGDPLAGPAYGVLDEVLATDLGNAQFLRLLDRADFDRRTRTPKGFYVDPFIDPIAKLLLPEIDARLAAGKTVFDDDFVAAYLRVVHRAFPQGMPPIAYLRPLVSAYPLEMQPAFDRLVELSGAGEIEASDTLDAKALALLTPRSAWGTVLLLTPEALGRLDGWDAVIDRATLATARARHGAFVVTHLRQPIGALFVFVAADSGAMLRLIDTFAAETQAHEGVLAPP